MRKLASKARIQRVTQPTMLQIDYNNGDLTQLHLK
jgi:hypothetical protein